MTGELHANALWDDVANGYRPQIRWRWEVLWESDTIVPFEHGDYNNDQEARAKDIAEEHLIERLKELLRDDSTIRPT